MKTNGDNMENYFLGIDIGGMSIKFGVFDEELKLIEKWSVVTDTTDCGKGIIPKTAEEINRIKEKAHYYLK